MFFFKNIYEKLYSMFNKCNNNNLFSKTDNNSLNKFYNLNNEIDYKNEDNKDYNKDYNKHDNKLDIKVNIKLANKLHNKLETKSNNNSHNNLDNKSDNKLDNKSDNNTDIFKEYNNINVNNDIDYNDYNIFKKYLNNNHLDDKIDILNNKYYVKSTYKIGCGGNGNVYKVYFNNNNNYKYALKISYNKNHFYNEINILKKLNNYHKNIIIFYDYFDNFNNKIYLLDFIKDFEFNYYNCIIFELSYKNTLIDFIEYKLINKYFDSLSVINIFNQIVSALKYAHNINIAHLDLKLENILIYNYDKYKYHIKIIDWGFSYDYSKNKLIDYYRGTKSYVAPEVLRRIFYKPNLADLWSLGVCIFSCLYGFYPFEIATNCDFRFDKINSLQNLGQFNTVNEILNIYNNLKHPLIYKDLEYILNNLLVINPEKRLSIHKLYEILNNIQN